jgi:DNA polymerase III epsilon subunit family exonuclease
MDKGFKKIVVIDFETTGLSSKKRAVEVAWFELNEKFEIIDEQSSLINPMIPIPPDASNIHGITDEMVADSPTLDEFVEDICGNPFASSDVCVVAHNLAFDLPLFRKYCGGVVELCTLKLTRKVFGDLPNHKLETISKHLDFSIENSHRAWSDALQVVNILQWFGSVTDLDSIIGLAYGQQGLWNKQYCATCFLWLPKTQKNCEIGDDRCPLFL